ncbi:UNVERIFIED_CONTAM: hypothetical protein FKN15_056455 [Acipenser sinensis]
MYQTVDLSGTILKCWAEGECEKGAIEELRRRGREVGEVLAGKRMVQRKMAAMLGGNGYATPEEKDKMEPDATLLSLHWITTSGAPSRLRAYASAWPLVPTTRKGYPHYLTRKGYPHFAAEVQEDLATEAFLRGLTPDALRSHVRLTAPASLELALTQAKMVEEVLEENPLIRALERRTAWPTATTGPPGSRPRRSRL